MFRQSANKLKKVDRSGCASFLSQVPISRISRSEAGLHPSHSQSTFAKKSYNADVIFICPRCLDKMPSESYNCITYKMKQL